MAVLAHPIEAHYSCTSIRGWPKLYVEVWGQTKEDANVEIGARQHRPQRDGWGHLRLCIAFPLAVWAAGVVSVAMGLTLARRCSWKRDVLPPLLPRPVRARVRDVGTGGLDGRPHRECVPPRPAQRAHANAHPAPGSLLGDKLVLDQPGVVVSGKSRAGFATATAGTVVATVSVVVRGFDELGVRLAPQPTAARTAAAAIATRAAMEAAEREAPDRGDDGSEGEPVDVVTAAGASVGRTGPAARRPRR